MRMMMRKFCFCCCQGCLLLLQQRKVIHFRKTGKQEFPLLQVVCLWTSSRKNMSFFIHFFAFIKEQIPFLCKRSALCAHTVCIIIYSRIVCCCKNIFPLYYQQASSHFVVEEKEDEERHLVARNCVTKKT